jgi:peptide/nickel transport system permease protein
MLTYVLGRVIQSALLLLIISMIVFVAVFAIGDPVEILVSPQATQVEIEQTRVALGLDKPLWNQYGVFLANALQGDLGRSFMFREPALGLVFSRLPATLELATCALILSVLGGVILGLIAAVHPDHLISRTIMVGSIFGFSLPTFWIGTLLVMIFGIYLGWLPSIGRGQVGEFLGIHSSFFTLDGLTHLLLPALTLALGNTALIIRLTQSGASDALRSEFIRFARAKGLSRKRIIWLHVLKAILIPLVTVIGIEFGALIAFSVVTETIYAWPGMGKLIVDSIAVLDRPVIVAYLMTIALIFVLINLLADLICQFIDPRIKSQENA